MRKFASRVELLNSSGDHLRYVPGDCAKAMVGRGSAEVASANSRIRTIRLIEAASTHALRTGRPEGAALFGTKFTRWVRLKESGTRIIEHHSRAVNYE